MPSRVLPRPMNIALLAAPFLLSCALGESRLFPARGETDARHVATRATAVTPGSDDTNAAAPAASGTATTRTATATAESFATVEDAHAMAVTSALAALSPAVLRSSAGDALQVAFDAYYTYRAAHPDRVRKPFLYYVDLGLDNRTARGYVFDMDALTVVDGPFTVAHGSGSSAQRNGVPTVFSNRSGSNASSLGLYLAEETYTFRGKAGGRPYASVGLRMRGESGPFNGAARRRGIVAHGAPYVTATAAGRSQGCPAMEQERAQRLLPMLANGGVVFIYSPNDEQWLSSDPWIAS